ncbi:MAG: hypothetical protein ACXQS2_02190 [Methermicoccaceae archaeon]
MVEEKYLVKSFITYMDRIGKRQASKLYYYLLKNYAEHINVAFEELNFNHMDNASLEMFVSTLAPRTANAFVSAVKSYFTYLKKTSITDDDYYLFSRMADKLSVKCKKIPRVITKKALSDMELEMLFDFLKYDKDEFLYASTVFHFYLGARPVELAQKFREGEIDFSGNQAERIVDFDNKLISIITAKTGDQRIIPLDDRIIPFVEIWFSGHEEIAEQTRGREWLTNHLRTKCKYLGFKVTAKTARRTFETKMRLKPINNLRADKQFYIDYWIGHTTSIPDIYTDFTEAIEDIKRSFAPHNYVFDYLD